MTFVLDHPLASTWLTELRDQATGPVVFRDLVARLAGALAWEATRALPTQPGPVRTPVADTVGRALAGPRPLLVPM